MNDLLRRVEDCVRTAGDMLAAEFCRPDGPRGSGGHAPIDLEIEAYLRDALLRLHPAGYLGEETGEGGQAGSDDCWVVDPHDGTSGFLMGYRGSAVSVALLRRCVPVLAVVFAPLPPDRGPDMIAWADGVPLRRNGAAVAARLHDRPLSAGDIVLFNQDSGLKPVGYGRLVQPARFVALPSIAYRLARVAVGDAQAAASLGGPVSYDYAAGHGLLLGAGGVLVDERGREVTYGPRGEGGVLACFGGSRQAAVDLAGRDWRGIGPEVAPRRRSAPRWPRLPDGPTLDRAIGCMFGQVIGDSLGSLVEFQSAAAIAARYPDGVRDLADGGTFNTIAGQPTDDSELALALARCLAERGGYDAEAVAGAYSRWFGSRPFDIGGTTRQALEAAWMAPDGVKADAARRAANHGSQSNGALMRAAPIGIAAPSVQAAVAMAIEDASMTHPNPACLNANAAFAAAIWTGIHGGDRSAMLEAAADVVGVATDDGLMAATLAAAREGTAPKNDMRQQGWVRIAFGNAFARLACGQAAEEALIETVGMGGDTDTNAAIAGALMGAAWGREAFPARWRMPVMACRPHWGLGGHQPRPMEYWPDELSELAELELASEPSPQTGKVRA